MPFHEHDLLGVTIENGISFVYSLREASLRHGPQSQRGVSRCSCQHVLVERREIQVLKSTAVTLELWRVHGNSSLLLMQFDGERTTTSFPWDDDVFVIGDDLVTFDTLERSNEILVLLFDISRLSSHVLVLG